MSGLRLEQQGSPTGWKRALFRAPIFLYRARLGFLLGHRFVMLEHTGRKSGETRQTVLEVVVDDPDAVYVAAGWGKKSQWYANVQANPDVILHLGSKTYVTRAESVSTSQAEELMTRYASEHRVALDKLAAYMLTDPGDTPEEQVRRVAENVPYVRLPKA